MEAQMRIELLVWLDVLESHESKTQFELLKVIVDLQLQLIERSNEKLKPNLSGRFDGGESNVQE
jgi:hypothetical protein